MSNTKLIAVLLVAVVASTAKGLKQGIASLCIGGGEATAIAVELV